MFALSFRAKLLLTMTASVAGVTGATLFITQQKVQETYQKLFQEKFTAQINYFSEHQTERLSPIMEKCAELVASVRLRTALEKNNVKDIYDDVWDVSDQPGQGGLRQLRRTTPGQPAPGAPGRSMNEIFVRVLDANGKVLHPVDPRAGIVTPAGKRRLESQLGFIRKSIDNLEAQQVGYLAPELGPGRTMLREVIVTRIVHPATGKTLGALVLGFPLPGLGETVMKEMSEILSGIWLEGQIYSRTIPEELREPLARQLAQEIKISEQPREAFIVPVAGVPHRVFYKLLNKGSPFPLVGQVCLYSLASANRTKRELRWWIIGFSALALLGAFAVNLLISRGLSGPIEELAMATGEIQRGNYDARVRVRSRDEIGRLAGSFNEMAEGLAQKEKYRSVLDLVSDEKVAHYLMSGNAALGGERREVSVLFCDIRGFTPLTQNMPPEEVIDLLNENMTAMARIVKEHQGVVDKFVGDQIMAIFGAPLSHGNDAHDAARCAICMILERARLNQTSRHKIQMGVGIATGEAVAGCMGSSDRLNYTVLGERVNLASRLCSKAAPMQVVVDQITRDRLGNSAVAEPLPPLEHKGFSEPIPAYQLVEVR
jgi:class 3 adenylate cyclase